MIAPPAETRPRASAATSGTSELQRRFDAAMKLVEQKRTAEAINQLRRLTEDFPGVPEVANNLAVLYVDRGEFDKAQAALESALLGRASYETIYRNLSNLNSRRAAKAYAQALNLDTSKVSANRLSLINQLDLPPEPAVKLAQPTPASTPAAAAPVPAPAPAPVPAPAPAPTPAPAPAPAKPVAPPAPMASAAAPAPAPVASKPAPAPVPAPTPAPALPAKPAAPASAPASAAPPPARPASAVAPTPNPAASAASSPATAAVAVGPDPKARAAADEAAVRKAVQAWAAAWESKDMQGYYDAYAPGFKGSEPSASAWQAARRVRIIGKKSIDVKVSNINVSLGAAQASASFTQAYAADQLRLVSRKTLYFELRDRRWVITRESAS